MINRFVAALALLLYVSIESLSAQETVSLYDSSASENVLQSMTVIDERSPRQIKRDSVRANKRVWTSVMGGPSYTPEASLGVGGAVLLSFKTNPEDSVALRSFLPMGFNVSINGTIVVAGAGTLFFNENKFRIYTSYGLRNEPANFYGVGFEEIDQTERGDLTTAFTKTNVYFNTRMVWELRPNFYLGAVTDINFSNSRDLNPLMAENPYVTQYKLRYTNIGVGALIQYDSRNDVATPTSGVLLSGMVKGFSRALGGSYNYQFIDLEYRQFQHLFGRATLAWTARTQMSYGDVPFTELPTFGSPFDLRGFYWGQYRDKSMGYGIVEYRQMLGSQEDYRRGRLISKFGYVAWVGTGTLGENPSYWSEWKLNYGFGLRAQIQPGKNFRLDMGRGVGGDGWMVYLNMTEAF